MAARYRATAKRIARDLPGSEQLMLFCAASGANWRRAGITGETAEGMVVRRLLDRDGSTDKFKLTLLGRAVLAALLVPVADDPA
jgi:hypothetical protein